MEAARLPLPGGTLVYDTFGAPDAARVTLLIHGFGGDRLSWLGLGPALGEDRFVVLPDLPSHGDTTLEGADVERLHEPLLPLLDTLAIPADRLDVVGISMGGVVASRLSATLAASGRPPRSLTLIASVGLGLEINRPVIRGFVEGPTVGAFDHLLRALALHVPPIPDDIKAFAVRRLAEGRLRGVADSLCGPDGQRLDIVATLERLVETMPVRLLYGRRDEILPWQHALAAPPRVALHLLRDAGHMVHWDAPETVLAILRNS